MADGKLNAFGTRCRSALTWLFLVLLIVEVKSAHCQEPDKPSLKETASSRTGQEEANDEITEFQGVLILPYELLVDYPAGEDDIKKLSTASHILFDPGVDDINEASPRRGENPEAPVCDPADVWRSRIQRHIGGRGQAKAS